MKNQRKRLLIFTDSRGQHKPRGTDHPVFAERLAADPRFDVTLRLCPMKWTTTLDFLEMFDAEQLADYDHVILYTGIVEWSPRKLSGAVDDLYHNTAVANADNAALNTRDYSLKIVNDKKSVCDSVFGADAMAAHFARPFDAEYEGEKTANLYGIEMAEKSLLPRLKSISNLIFINANRFVPGWRGDYPRERPSNMDETEAYSRLFAESLGDHCIDLLEWDDEQVKVNTCDNLHLTKAGSDWIHTRLMEKMLPSVFPDWKIADFPGIAAVRPVDGTQAEKLRTAAGLGKADKLASLIIGLRMDDSDPLRRANLDTMLRWLSTNYGDLFDLLIVEQDDRQRFDPAEFSAVPGLRYEFIYNPSEYNRGWGYNVAVRHFCPNAQVVALLDTDVLTGANFVEAVLDCHAHLDVVSPYRNVYYTTESEAVALRRSFDLTPLTDSSRILNPVTLTGGIVIMKRATYMALNGYEQYLGYSSEDRAMDVTVYNHIPSSRIRICPDVYAHLYHRVDKAARKRFNEIYAHLQANYCCKYDKVIKPDEFIHRTCNHADAALTKALIDARAQDFGDIDLYRKDGELTINGQRVPAAPAVVRPQADDVIFPPDFTNLTDYPKKEIYAAAPPCDEGRIAALYNRFKGERCFIIGNGPSLNNHDLSLLKDEYSFGVNSFYYKTRETGFRPTFYVVEDSSVMKENVDEIRAFEAPYKFFPTIYKSLHPTGDNVYFFNMNRGFYEKSSPNYVVPRFSTDASKVLYCGQSVTYINLQLAYFLGFTEVYLIGMDFSYVIPQSHARKGDVLTSDTDDPNHFHKDYFGKGKTWKDPKLDRVLLNYMQAKLSYEATGRKVFNATVGGHLEVFPRVDYNALLGNASKPARPAATPAPKAEPKIEPKGEAKKQGGILQQIDALIGATEAMLR